MPLQGEYADLLPGWQKDQVDEVLAAGDTRAVDLNGMSIVLFTVRGAKSGLLRRLPLMRVEHEGAYAAVASKGGAPKHPDWYHSIKANPEVMIQDGTEASDFVAREISGAERDEWWERCVAAYPPYAEYEQKAGNAGRIIPVFVCEPVG
ncbi:nitroreductase family deazaflavin-dependent oxidoreductase [Granulicoccus sp. GXG6511]|uniref:nitroreductase family deazaflavin-dependent oxidoreductase n=1 Tax=Granulicoccus sp. GXG6511 TaxID=3381351 RepID=UPI003D7DE11B